MLHIDRCFAGPVNIDVSEGGAFTRSSSAESDWGAGGKRGSGGYLGSMSASMLRSRSQSLLPITNQSLTKSPNTSFSVRRSHRRTIWFKPALALLVLCALSGATYISTRPSPALPAGDVMDLSEAEHRRRGGVVDESHISSYHHHQTVMADDKLPDHDQAADDHRQLGQQEHEQQRQHAKQQPQEAAAKVESAGANLSQLAGGSTQQQVAEQQQQHEQAAAELDPAVALDHAEVGAEEAQQHALEELEEIHQQLGDTQGDAAAAGAATAEVSHEQQQHDEAAAAALAAAAAAQQQQQQAGAHEEVVSAQEAQQAEQAHLAEQAAAHQAALEAAHQAALAAQHAAALEQQQAAHDQAVLEAQHAAHAAQQAQHAEQVHHHAQHVQQQQQHLAAEQHVQQHVEVPPPRVPSLYDSGLSALDIHGNEVRMADLHGRAAIILNVASHCGYTQPNYVQLQQIYERYQMYGLEILAFPCNQFGAQEPGTPEEILQFVESNFHVRFPLMGKVDVNGEHAHPIFQFLKLHTPPLPGHPANEDISWNFNKFLVDKWGHPVKRYGPDLIQYELETDVYNELVKVYGNEQHLQQ